MIREATEKDIPRIVELGSRSLAEGPYKDLLADKPEVTTNLATRLLDLKTAQIIVADEGQIIGVFAFIVFPHYFSGEIVAGEVIWYVTNEARVTGNHALELLWAAEKKAFELGAIKMQLTAPTDEIARMYGMLRGYVKVETAFQRSLERFSAAGGTTCP